MRCKIIITTVKPALTDKVVDAAKAAGATGATILSGRGTGCHEAKTFFGLTLEPPSDIIMMLIEEHFVQEILEAIAQAGEFAKPGTGIAFQIDVEDAVGITHQAQKITSNVEELL